MKLSYATRTGAVLMDGDCVAGAFDREHHDVLLPPSAQPRELELVVERYSLPSHGLPSGAGVRWSILTHLAREEPRRHLDVTRAPAPSAYPAGPAPLWGHSHLDVAWLWDYTQARRKAVRTFVNAVTLAETDPAFVFMQSQPQLYEFVHDAAPDLFARVARLARDGRFDPSVAALWVEPDANAPSGESLLMQMLYAQRYVRERFGIDPSIAWLPDTFGFPNTLPTLLAHAGIPYFATTKLQWNDTTRFPHHQFRWRGPDGSEIVSALLASYEGSPNPFKLERAKRRGEPAIVGYGDGGGGPTRRHLAQAAGKGHWERPLQWFTALAAREQHLPVHDDELYLEYHRGTYTTHHDVKAANASLERRLAVAQEQLAWCMAVRAQPEIIARLRAAIDGVWRDVLCNQFHDVLAGAAIREAYEEAHELYERAGAALAVVESSVTAMLPRGRVHEPDACAPSVAGNGELALDNGIVRAVFDERGTLREIATRNGRNAIAQGNLLAAYRDRPKMWDAWNLDAGYERKRVRVKPGGFERGDDGIDFRFLVGSSPLTMHVELRRGEPFVRVTCAVDWRERHVILRLENWLALETDSVIYGAPHGTITRSAKRESKAQRARFEVPGQRYAFARDELGGVALFALDTYGWSARALGRGGVHVGHSLLRSPSWPDPQADIGEQTLAWAFVPVEAGVSIGALERAWETFALPPRVRLFESADDAVVVAACKPAADGDGVIVRVRETDGALRSLRIRSGARARSVEPVDALERPAGGDGALDGEYLTGTIGPYALRSFRVRF